MKKLVFAAVALIVLLGIGWFSTRVTDSDEQQIRSLLMKAEGGVRSRSVGTVLSCLSDDYNGVGGNPQQIRLLLMQGFSNASKVEFSINEPQIQITGSQAAAQTRLHAKYSTESGTSTEFNPDVTLRFKQEDQKRYLIFPVKEWRISSASASVNIPELNSF